MIIAHNMSDKLINLDDQTTQNTKFHIDPFVPFHELRSIVGHGIGTVHKVHLERWMFLFPEMSLVFQSKLFKTNDLIKICDCERVRESNHSWKPPSVHLQYIVWEPGDHCPRVTNDGLPKQSELRIIQSMTNVKGMIVASNHQLPTSPLSAVSLTSYCEIHSILKSIPPKPQSSRRWNLGA